MATVVKARDDEDIRSLLSRFKKQVLQANIVEELRERRFYKKPSELRKERLAARRRGRPTGFGRSEFKRPQREGITG